MVGTRYSGFMADVRKLGRLTIEEATFRELITDISKLSDPAQIQDYLIKTRHLSSEDFSSRLLDIAQRVAMAQLTRLCAAGDTKAISLVLDAAKSARTKKPKATGNELTPSAFLPQDRTKNDPNI